ncbi:hypothetical protein H310_02331 [Aphanomyces invadans]|uniref:EF-hand domain-containing protein n=1 Tax=Aphanomyces invadans TaxID=157072 RepID=A0A024UQQ2_9STRA|nr:hypothetical protein H310_02331 [Aphanomyces invadans]ETW07928.1 hypothetical protein H310_02331 [Aphanomyces invadans]|eukprot:XP_008864021.1 hypothetical protein H310_02331 [Aphanomyces invadans]
MGGESPQKRRLTASNEPVDMAKSISGKHTSLPNALPALNKRGRDMAVKVLPDAPTTTLPEVNPTPSTAGSNGAASSPGKKPSEASPKKVTPQAAPGKRHKSILQVSRSKKTGDIVLESQQTIDTVIKYQMGQCELRKLKDVFNYIDADRVGQISYEEFFEFIDENRNPYSESLFRLIDADRSGTIDFEEFVHALTTYCMFTREEILQFAFRTFDDDDSGSIDESEFAKLANMVNDGKPLFSGNFNRALKEFDKKNEGVIDFAGFDLLNRRYPMILFPCFRLQDRIQKATLGEAHWLRIHKRYYDMLKDEQFRKKHGGAAPPVSTTTKLKLIFGVGTFEVYQPE